MKMQIQKMNTMNVLNKILGLSTVVFMLIFTTSCSKELIMEEIQPVESIQALRLQRLEMTEQQAVEVMGDALKFTTSGLAADIEKMAKIVKESTLLEEPAELCGESFENTYTESVNNPSVSAEYAKTMIWNVACYDDYTLSDFDFESEMAGEHETPIRAASSTGTAAWNVDAVSVAINTFYKIEGTYNRSGDYYWYVNSRNVYDTNLTIEVAEIKVSKTTTKIISGEASIHMEAENGVPNDTQTFDASITFHEDGTVDIEINGTIYPIEL